MKLNFANILSNLPVSSLIDNNLSVVLQLPYFQRVGFTRQNFNFLIADYASPGINQPTLVVGNAAQLLRLDPYSF